MDSYTTKYVLTEAFNCMHAHVQRDRKTDRNISVYMRTVGLPRLRNLVNVYTSSSNRNGSV